MNNFARALALGATAVTLVAGAAFADDFHGFDPATYDGKRLSADQYAAMVKDATAVKAPRNGQKLVFGFANLQRDITFCAEVEKARSRRTPTLAGIELLVADNQLDGADGSRQRRELHQPQCRLCHRIPDRRQFRRDDHAEDERGRHQGRRRSTSRCPAPPSSAPTIPSPAIWAAPISPRRRHQQVRQGQGQAGLLRPRRPAAIRRRSRRCARRASCRLPRRIARVPRRPRASASTPRTRCEESFTQTNNILGRIPAGVPIMTTAINDQSTTGMLRAVQAGGPAGRPHRGRHGCRRDSQTLMAEPDLRRFDRLFPRTYGNYLLPIALAALAGNAAAGGAGPSRDGQQGEYLSVLSQVQMRR